MHFLGTRYAWPTALTLTFATSLGCIGSQGPEGVASVSGSSVAGAAMEQYDADGDGFLAATELAACPALDLASFDSDGDQKISEQELEDRFEQLFSGGAPLVNMTCTVVDGRRRLAGVNVEFVPEQFLGSSFRPATGVTDDNGIAMIAIADEELPEAQRGFQLCQVGVYRIKLSGGRLPESLQETGFIVDGLSRGGMDTTIDVSKLK